jgi:hypothetical protein
MSKIAFSFLNIQDFIPRTLVLGDVYLLIVFLHETIRLCYFDKVKSKLIVWLCFVLGWLKDILTYIGRLAALETFLLLNFLNK